MQTALEVHEKLKGDAAAVEANEFLQGDPRTLFERPADLMSGLDRFRVVEWGQTSFYEPDPRRGHDHQAPALIQPQLRPSDQRPERPRGPLCGRLPVQREQKADGALPTDLRRPRCRGGMDAGPSRDPCRLHRRGCEGGLLHRPSDLQPLPQVQRPPLVQQGQGHDPQDAQRITTRRLRDPYRPRSGEVLRVGEGGHRGQGAGDGAHHLPQQGPALRRHQFAAQDQQVFGQGGRGAHDQQAGQRYVVETQAPDQAQDQGHRRRPHQALRQAKEQERPCLSARQLSAARARGLVHLRGHARPGEGHRRREARHGSRHSDGPAHLRRRGLRQDRGGHPGGVQGRGRWSPGGRAGADHHSRCPALPHLPRAPR